jgi:hypothetical protein
MFDLADSKYSVSGEYNKCLLHLWSAERNVVRRILDSEVRNGNLRLMVQKLGQSRPSKLEICKGHDLRTPTARKAARSVYQQHLRRALERNFPDFTLTKLSNAMDLERSFGPIYARGVLRQGRTAFAVLGVNQQETQSSIDAALTFVILWLDACRESQDQRVLVEGVKLFLPPGSSALTCERMAHLNADAAKWQLYEFDERHDELTAIDFGDRGNIATRLVHCPDEAAVLERFAKSIHRVLSLLPESEVAVLSTAEVAFRWRGLEFARARLWHEAGSCSSAPIPKTISCAVRSGSSTNARTPTSRDHYWSRVQWHHARGEFQKFGYFPGRELAEQDPLLLLVAPTLHVHPATDTVLRYLAAEIDWTLVAIDERWRDQVRVIFRKRQANRVGAPAPRPVGAA